MTNEITGYWFAASDELPHGDKRKIVIGETLSVKGKIKLCVNGLHASREPFDALFYASGSILYKVISSGDIKEVGDKYCSRNRKAVAVIDAAPICRQFAREQALSVAHLWDMPTVVKKYLETGDEKLRIVARAASYAAGRAAVDATYDATHAATYAAYGTSTTHATRAAAYATSTAIDAVTKATSTAPSVTRAAARKRFNAMIEEAFLLQ